MRLSSGIEFAACAVEIVLDGSGVDACDVGDFVPDLPLRQPGGTNEFARGQHLNRRLQDAHSHGFEAIVYG